MRGEVTRAGRIYRWTLDALTDRGEIRVQCAETGCIKLNTVLLPQGSAWTADFVATQARRILDEAYAARAARIG